MMADGDLDGDVRLEIYRHFVEHGSPPVAAQIGNTVGATALEVEDSLRRLAEAHVIVLAPGTPYIWMANPFSALPTPFRARVDGRSYWGNCIWDSLGIVAMLGGSGTVESFCPDCAEPLELEARDGDLQDPGYVVHYAVPARRWWDDIGFN